MSRGTCDIVLIGVGGQGILTIGEILLDAAVARGVPATFSPTKGMAQRGGFVKAELRLGAADVGPRIRAGAADAVVSMERSESLKGLQFAKQGGVFVLYDAVWEPTGVMLGVDEYPTRERVLEAIAATGARSVFLDPDARPAIGGKPASPNVFTLGALVAVTALVDLLGADAVEKAIAVRWPRAAEANLAAFRFGLGS
ncbi:MAG: 2-oxoacid:acceptor oxidoreductase family protein [Candidatus Bipolaricaulota bacterium]|nr:2-oxoacid:acceptor oxidoreductase family protein [Candidatus Bipolaricaulota bacterium]